MYHDFLGPRGLQGTHMDTLKPKEIKSMTFTLRGGFFTFWAIVAHCVPRWALQRAKRRSRRAPAGGLPDKAARKALIDARTAWPLLDDERPLKKEGSS